jgi:hypothetical protein
MDRRLRRDAFICRVRRGGAAAPSVRLETADDTRCVVPVDCDLRKRGIQRETRYEITPAELIALIRAHGGELPGENHVRAANLS